MIDIYDANMSPIGSMEREQAHQNAKWHRTFHCWIVNRSERSLIFQLRSLLKETHPGKLDISAAGHLAAGESVEDGIREIEEELGLDVQLSDLIGAGERIEVSDTLDGRRNREFQSVFFLCTTLRLEDYSLDPKEVAGLISVPIDLGLDLFAHRVATIPVRTVDVTNNGKLVARQREVTRTDFLPRYQRYYMAALISAERICNGKIDIAIS